MVNGELGTDSDANLIQTLTSELGDSIQKHLGSGGIAPGVGVGGKPPIKTWVLEGRSIHFCLNSCKS